MISHHIPQKSPAEVHRYYPGLDGLRAVAVGLVLAAHGGLPFFRSGGVGVDIFFVLSGFLITGILLAEWSLTGTICFRNFYARRFLRLGPCLVLTCVLTGVGVWWVYGRVPFTELALSLSYTANWARALYNHPMGWFEHIWSLCIEEQYYLIWPLIILLLERSLASGRIKGAILLALAGVVALYRAEMTGRFTAERINFGFDTRIDALLVGSALAYLLPVWRLNGGRGFATRVFSRAVAPGALLVLFAVAHAVTWQDPWMSRVGFCIVAAASALVIAEVALDQVSPLGALLKSGLFVYLGRISYGLYLLHFSVYHLVEHNLPAGSLSSTLRFGLKLALTLLLAAASFHFMERPFLRLKARFVATPAVGTD
jgi:peptidoglycan/LPS O-acetylase OafA/YrhL